MVPRSMVALPLGTNAVSITMLPLLLPITLPVKVMSPVLAGPVGPVAPVPVGPVGPVGPASAGAASTQTPS